MVRAHLLSSDRDLLVRHGNSLPKQICHKLSGNCHRSKKSCQVSLSALQQPTPKKQLWTVTRMCTKTLTIFLDLRYCLPSKVGHMFLDLICMIAAAMVATVVMTAMTAMV